MQRKPTRSILFPTFTYATCGSLQVVSAFLSFKKSTHTHIHIHIYICSSDISVLGQIHFSCQFWSEQKIEIEKTNNTPEVLMDQGVIMNHYLIKPQQLLSFKGFFCDFCSKLSNNLLNILLVWLSIYFWSLHLKKEHKTKGLQFTTHRCMVFDSSVCTCLFVCNWHPVFFHHCLNQLNHSMLSLFLLIIRNIKQCIVIFVSGVGI